MLTETDASSRHRHLQAEHARALGEQSDRHAVVLESLLAILRSDRLDDQRARAVTVDAAAAALVDLRTSTDHLKQGVLETVTTAFSRLRADLHPLVRFGDLDIQFVDPPATGRALPGDVAQAARAIVRNAVLEKVDRGDATRIRVQWDCDGLNLLMDILDDGDGALTAHHESLRPITEQVAALDGTLAVSGTPGWGSSLAITLPLDPPPEPEPLADVALLSPRERDVLRELTAGARNRTIAGRLGISENTVKFHVSNVLRKVGARTRAELGALARNDPAQ